MRTAHTEEKISTERAYDAVNALQHAGILLAITSGRRTVARTRRSLEQPSYSTPRSPVRARGCRRSS
jgi:hypothetical protein